MNSKILIVEDEAKLREILCDYFSSKGELPVEASNGIQALELIDENEFDAVLLDIMMPELDGLSVCRAVRRTNDVPIIFLTALSDEEDKLLGYELGADDYVTKPFDIKEVLARVAVQIRRMEGSFSEGNLVYQGLELDRENFCVRVDQTELPKITRQEFSILELLLKHPKKVFSKEEIFEYAWEEAYMGETKTLDVHISNIRKKIKSVTSKEYIETIWGIGYRLHP